MIWSTILLATLGSAISDAVSALRVRDIPACDNPPTALHLKDTPQENYFYSDCHVAAQVVVTTPQPNSNFDIVRPRLIVAWPAGNSGVCAFFEPTNSIKGSLLVTTVNITGDRQLELFYKPPSSEGGLPSVGVSGVLEFNSSTRLSIPILGSVRTIRDYTEGGSLTPEIQNAVQFSEVENGGAVLKRVWFDNETVVELGFAPFDTATDKPVRINDRTLEFEAGRYRFFADFNYPQLTQLTPSEVLNPGAQSLISQYPDQTKSLSFLSYSEKLLAGAWRFLTYFGRDSMIAALLLEPVLTQGEGGAIEAVIGAVLERIDRTDGSVSHEETLGDYATYQHMRDGVNSTAPIFDYKMIDTDYYLPVLMEQYFLRSINGSARVEPLFETKAGSFNTANQGLTWGNLALINAEKIMSIASRFAAEGNQTKENLVHLKNSGVGQWRDSPAGLGGGRIPYDVNTALVPAALRSIAALSSAGVYGDHSSDWPGLALTYAKVWEDSTLKFFSVSIPVAEAKSRLATYVEKSGFKGPSNAEQLDGDEELGFHAVALDGRDNVEQVLVMNTDDCFRLFFVNGTDQEQLSSFLNQSAKNIMRTFPAGLLTPVGLLVANPAYGLEQFYVDDFGNSAYHGTVVWSWQLAMMARGLELQLDRCNSNERPEFCDDLAVHGNVLKAYDALWDVIEANTANLSTEVWSWVYEDGFKFTPLGAISSTESNAQQLWSLTFLAVKRNAAFSTSK